MNARHAISAAKYGALAAMLLVPGAPAWPSVAAQPAGARVAGPIVERPIRTVTPAALADAIADAARYLATHRGARVVLQLPAGTFDLSGGQQRRASLDFSGIDACPGALVLRGEGMDRTTIIKDDDLIGIVGRNTGCLTIADLTLGQTRLEVSQGKVASSSPGEIVVDIPAGFPTLGELTAVPPSRDANGRAIYWLKRYVVEKGVPRYVEGERATRWLSAAPVPGAARRWAVRVREGRPGAPRPETGDLVSFIAKSGGQMYRFVNGRDITFDRVRWAGDSRGKFRRVDRVTVRNSVVRPPPPVNGVPFALATSAGGPQIGHPGDPLTTGHLIENNVFERLGDDAIALADASGIVRNNRISDAVRGILIVGKGDVRLENNVLVRARVLRKETGGTARRPRPCDPDEHCLPRRPRR